MLKIKDNVDLKELEKFGFKNNIWKREKDGIVLYFVVITNDHRYIQIRSFVRGELNIAGKLQVLLFDLIQAGLVEKVEE